MRFLAGFCHTIELANLLNYACLEWESIPAVLGGKLYGGVLLSRANCPLTARIVQSGRKLGLHR